MPEKCSRVILYDLGVSFLGFRQGYHNHGSSLGPLITIGFERENPLMVVCSRDFMELSTGSNIYTSRHTRNRLSQGFQDLVAAG